ncbi:hypothetical protein VIGAN_02317700 [Vigna angularis var. angularis]|uniref:Uncharacterized protein n=1 Tax=Vigna angularis var. angularis TaxID=157739 RepID=A0A0S3RHQ7_PHAAN|nr:hypothetical protein VIGAN_02317700 [Vigna angularis var. angularis]
MLGKKIEVKEAENIYLNESIERMDKELQQIKGANCRLSHQVKNSENLLKKDLELLEIKRLRAVETLNEEFCRYIEKLNMDYEESRLVGRYTFPLSKNNRPMPFGNYRRTKAVSNYRRAKVVGNR